MAQTGQLIIVSSDKDIHFTGAIALNAEERESIQLPAAIAAGLQCRSVLRAIAVISDQNLSWELILWSRRVEPSIPPTLSLDLNPFLGKWSFDSGDSIRIGGAGPFYSYIDGLNVPYQDEGQEGRLHVSLVNRSAAAKTAGAAGEVVVRFTLEPTLGW